MTGLAISLRKWYWQYRALQATGWIWPNESKFANEGKDVETVRGVFHHHHVCFGRSKIGSEIRALGVWTGIGHIPDIKDSVKPIHIFMPSCMMPLQFRSTVRALPFITIKINPLFRGNPVLVEGIRPSSFLALSTPLGEALNKVSETDKRSFFGRSHLPTVGGVLDGEQPMALVNYVL